MSTHSRLAPSARYRWQLCPGSVAACARYEGDGSSSPAAIDGTHSHTLLEHCIKNDQPAKSYFGMVLTDHEGMFAPDKERCERVQIALDYILARKEELSATVIAEQRVDPSGCLGRDDMGGTVDVQLHSPTVLELVDYKDGVNLVDAKDNPQLEQYFFGVIGELMKQGKFPHFLTVRLTIIQPKVKAFGRDPITFHDYNINDLLAKMPTIISEAAATDLADAPLVAGEKQCKYCPHKINCKTFTDWSFGRAGIKFEAVLSEVEAKSGDRMSDQQLCELIEAAPLIRKMLEEAEAEALKRITSGHPVPGLKVVNGPGRRSWAFTDEEMETKLKRFHIPKDALWKRSIISPAQAEKLKWQKRDGSEYQLSEKQVTLMNREFVKTSEGKLTVVPEVDRREARSYGDLSKMFQAVPAAPAAEAPLPSWLS